MVRRTVKRKLHFFDVSRPRPKAALGVGLTLLALLTFIVSLLPVPPVLIERWFSRTTFPKISGAFRFIADPMPVAWLDVLIVAGILYICVCVWRRRWLAIAGAIALGYLVFFWSWGLNYRRVPLLSKLQLDPDSTSPAAIETLARISAGQINTLYEDPARIPYDEDKVRTESAARVSRVVEALDGIAWSAPARVKVSVVGNLWFRIAGVDGLFNPVIHEPIINDRVLDIERPFVISHELAHVRGYPDEGDANFVAMMSTLMSDDPHLAYSGWLHLWLYVRSRDLDPLLHPGPRQDIQRIFDRLRGDRVPWVANLQSTMLDLFLKANRVPEGVRSYSRVVLLTSGTQKTWNRFR